jgi:hypothetical protein
MDKASEHYYIRDFNWDIKTTALMCGLRNDEGNCAKTKSPCCYDECPLKLQSEIWPMDNLPR